MIIPVHSQWAAIEYYRTNWAVPDWYVDADNGDDSNAGTSAGAALASLEELSARLAVPMPCNHSVTAHIAYSATSYGTLAVQFIQGAAGAYFDAIGDVAYTSIGTITSYTSRVAASNAEARLVASLVSDWTSHVGKRVDVRSGASAGAIAWVGKVNPQSAGVTVAGITRFSTISSTGFGSSAVAPAASSDVSLAALPTIRLLGIRSYSANSSAASTKPNRHWGISSLDIGSLSTTGQGIVDGCSIGTITPDTAYSGAIPRTINRSILRGASWGTDSELIIPGWSMNFCQFLGATGALAIFPGLLTQLNGCLAYNCYFQCSDASGFAALDSGFFDYTGSAGAAIVSARPASVFVSGCWGNGNSSGVYVATQAAVKTSGTNYLTGSLGDVRVNATYVPWSALPWTDGERSGEATLAVPAPGTHEAEATSYVDVTVPYVLSTQKIMVGYKTFGGTTGQILGKYVSATSIRIVSSSALDTSVVTWHILPVGDNCVIRS